MTIHIPNTVNYLSEHAITYDIVI